MQQTLTDGVGLSGGGDALAGTLPISVNTALVWYVDSVTGTDDAAHGFEASRPLASLQYLISTVGLTDGDIVVLASTHVESIAVDTTISVANVTILGIGTSARPTITVAASKSLLLSASGITFRNILFGESATGPRTAARILALTATTTAIEFIGCEFRSGPSDLYVVANPEFAAWVCCGSVGATVGLRFTNCLFVSTAITAATASGAAIYAVTARYNCIVFDGVTFDGGAIGWYRWAANLAEGNGRTIVKGVNVSLVRGSDMLLGSTAPGFVQVYGPSGGGRVLWGSR
jgi:hypothetical protein